MVLHDPLRVSFGSYELDVRVRSLDVERSWVTDVGLPFEVDEGVSVLVLSVSSVLVADRERMNAPADLIQFIKQDIPVQPPPVGEMDSLSLKPERRS